jgi:hypothetical protein
MTTTKHAWRVGFCLVALVTGAVIACSSDKDDGKGRGPVGEELARAEIDENGGTISATGITIEIPPGAVTKKTTVTIGGLDPNQIGLPSATKIAGGAYILGPDDTDFLKPVRVRVALDPNLDPKLKGAAVLFRATPYTNDWKAVGSSKIEGNDVVGQTTHFSWWAPASATETSCFNGGCVPDGATANVPPEQQGLWCKLPIEGPGVVCKGTTLPHYTAPFECHCEGSTEIIARFETHPPGPPDLKPYAQQCGGVCPPHIELTCGLEMTCDPPTGGDEWTCIGKRPPSFTCRHKKGEPSSMCTCANGKVFYIPNTTKPPEEIEVGQGYFHTCGGTCTVEVGPGQVETDSGPPGVCNLHTTRIEIGGGGTIEDPCYFRPPPCKDGNTYSIECDNLTPEAPCHCYVNGVKTKDVIGNCQPTGYEEGKGGWYACGFPQPER